MYHQSSWYDLQFLRYRVWQTEIGNYGSFFALYPTPLKTQKIRILKKWKKLLEISFYTRVPNTTIIWGTVPEIWAFFWPLYPPNNQETQNFKTMKKIPWDFISLHMCTKNHNHMVYTSWDMEYDRHNFLSFYAIFCPFTPLWPQK